jgi:hypothetical protein
VNRFQRTAEAIELTEYAKKVGADGSLQVCLIKKLTQEGLPALQDPYRRSGFAADSI